MTKRTKTTLFAVCGSAALLLATTGNGRGAEAAAKNETVKKEGNNPVVVMKTSLGDLEIVLYQDKAPKTVANFLRYADDGFYDGTVFHRVIRNFMIQGGGYTTEGMKQRKEKAGTRKAVENEADNGISNEMGTSAMARTSAPHSATAQFFINTSWNRMLDHVNKTPRGWGYCVFGEVRSGLDVVNKIRKVKCHRGMDGTASEPDEPVVILSVRRKEKAAPTLPAAATKTVERKKKKTDKKDTK